MSDNEDEIKQINEKLASLDVDLDKIKLLKEKYKNTKKLAKKQSEPAQPPAQPQIMQMIQTGCHHIFKGGHRCFGQTGNGADGVPYKYCYKHATQVKYNSDPDALIVRETYVKKNCGRPKGTKAVKEEKPKKKIGDPRGPYKKTIDKQEKINKDRENLMEGVREVDDAELE